MELCLLGLLAAGLIGCTIAGVSVILWLAVWALLLCGYGLRRRYSAGELVRAARAKIGAGSSVLFSFLLIGMLSAALRACGTVSCVVSMAGLIPQAALVLPGSFLLCALMSLCTGSNFASSATAGVICASVAQAAGLPMPLACGAIFSGCSLGDRISPVSAPVTLCAEISGTSARRNIRVMAREFPVPFLFALGVYAVLGRLCAGGGAMPVSAAGVSLPDLLPAGVILACCLLRANSRIILAGGILSAMAAAVLFHGMAVPELLGQLFLGCVSANPAVPSGGGAVSMLRPAVVILIASCYLGIFELTGFLQPLSERLERLPISAAGKDAVRGALASAVAGSQTLAVILAAALSGEKQPEELADSLQSYAILFPALVPWNTSFAVPAAAVGAGLGAIPCAVYLWAVPLWYWLRHRGATRRTAPVLAAGITVS